ncbi:rhodanese-like domain-containing protein [Taibaiella helva]|uniref:rhodanese-like domain-containing protein n=1 Tax=Taibaiella helva TaxID=2301235 RepID=UPI000E57A3E1|nr:rhodanese-like domain-containing protein [Taibaiella helva]
MKTMFLSVGIVLLIYIAYRTYRFVKLDKGLEAKIAAGAVILDVRTKSEFATGHIAGAVNISLGTIRERYTMLDTGKTYITCCSHGLRSVKVQQLLEARGFRHVYNGGAWTDLEQVVLKVRGR